MLTVGHGEHEVVALEGEATRVEHAGMAATVAVAKVVEGMVVEGAEAEGAEAEGAEAEGAEAEGAVAEGMVVTGAADFAFGCRALVQAVPPYL